MAILVNAFTSQTPITGGLTQSQLIKLIPAPRVFVKSSVTQPCAIPGVKAAGATPSGWTDLGIVSGMAKVGYAKKTKDVKTGIDNVLRASYADDKTATVEFSLSQVDDIVMQSITGLTASQITSNSIYTFHLGQEDLAQMALLLVVESKLDGKEWQFFSPNVYMNFAFADQGDAFELKCTATLPFFSVTGQTNQDVLSATIFA